MNILGTTLKELLEAGYTPREFRNIVEELIERIGRYAIDETDDK